jgi:transposase
VEDSSGFGGMRVWRMGTGISFTISSADRARLEAIVADRNSPQKHVWRCRIVLLTAAGLGTNAIMREASVAKTAVWRWQQRFAEEGVAGLLRDKTRPSRIPSLAAEVTERVVALTLTDPPAETTHWTATMMVEQIGVSVSWTPAKTCPVSS